MFKINEIIPDGDSFDVLYFKFIRKVVFWISSRVLNWRTITWTDKELVTILSCELAKVATFVYRVSFSMKCWFLNIFAYILLDGSAGIFTRWLSVHIKFYVPTYTSENLISTNTIYVSFIVLVRFPQSTNNFENWEILCNTNCVEVPKVCHSHF